MHQQFNPRNKDLLVNINGKIVHRDEARVSPFDSVVQGGDAVWEGLRLYNGRIFRLNEHLARLRSSAKALAFGQIPSDEHITSEIARTLKANDMRDGVHIRLTLTRGEKYTSGMDPRLNTAGPTLVILAEFKDPVYGTASSRGGIKLITSSIRRFPPDCLDPKIHHNNLIQSILAKIEANNAGADDAIMLDTRGFIAETNATHVFLVPPAAGHASASAGQTSSLPAPHAPPLLTPFCHACPEGITRAAVLELCQQHSIPHAQRNLTLTELYRASEAFCTGTMGELVPVMSADGRTIGDGTAGPITTRLVALFRELTSREGVRLVD